VAYAARARQRPEPAEEVLADDKKDCGEADAVSSIRRMCESAQTRPDVARGVGARSKAGPSRGAMQIIDAVHRNACPLSKAVVIDVAEILVSLGSYRFRLDAEWLQYELAALQGFDLVTGHFCVLGPANRRVPSVPPRDFRKASVI
jgi:hypothetical protein